MDIKKLIAVATGEIAHENAGLCPDMVASYDSRDPECLACQIIVEAERAALEKQEPALVQHREPLVDRDGNAIGTSDWINGDGLPWWPHRKLYARPVPAEPVNARLVEALRMATSYMWSGPGAAGAMQRAVEAIASAEAQHAKPVRLTEKQVYDLADEIPLPFDRYGDATDLKPSVRAIESASLRANGFKVDAHTDCAVAQHAKHSWKYIPPMRQTNNGEEWECDICHAKSSSDRLDLPLWGCKGQIEPAEAGDSIQGEQK